MTRRAVVLSVLFGIIFSISILLYGLLSFQECEKGSYKIKSNGFRTKVYFIEPLGTEKEILRRWGKFHSFDIGDTDGDGREELGIVMGKIFSKRGNRTIILSVDEEETVNIHFDVDMTSIRPWKIRFGDINGDGKDEVALGVYKTTPFHHRMDNRLFFYELKKEKQILFPIFRASRLISPYYDFEFVDMGGYDAPMSIERTEDNQRKVRIYKKDGFGFILTHESEVYPRGDHWNIVEGEYYIHGIKVCPKDIRRVDE
ncbi:MAG: hypothetical protein Q4Q17_00550 [Tissierellia bacterium]|nr:hypothetical protein [Tissierellia bacterium]